jgi:hypothetical protein
MISAGLLLSAVLLACEPGNTTACEAFAPIAGDKSVHVAYATPLDRLRACRQDGFEFNIDTAGDVVLAPECRPDRSLSVARHRFPAALRERLAALPAPRTGPLPEVATDPSLVGPQFAAPLPILTAIVKASARTGADFEFLLKTAALESSFDQNDEAKTSTAVGLYQFITNTWLFMIREAGPEFGLGDLAAAIAVTDKGEFRVIDADTEAAILRMRYDPELSAIMAGAFARYNAEFAARQLGRELNPGELYIAHFLGANAGVELIRLTEKDPRALANKHFARAARANKSIFYDGRRPRTIAEVHECLLNKYRRIPILANGTTQRLAVTAPQPALPPDPEPVGSIR